MIELSPWVPIVGAPLIAAFSAIIVAWINKKRERADPIDRAIKLIDQLQEDRQDDRQMHADLRSSLDRTESKVDELYDIVGIWRGYGIDWELWYADGMPHPPGPPKRPAPILSHSGTS